MIAVNDDYPRVHQELVRRHKGNFRSHAEAVLANQKEFQEMTDCGMQWTPTDTHLVEAWSEGLGLKGSDELRALCGKIDQGVATPELDTIVGMYVCRLTGKMPDGSKVILL